jgi:hypothetical protein
MIDKYITTITYLILGIILSLYPSILQYRTTFGKEKFREYYFSVGSIFLLAAIAAGLAVKSVLPELSIAFALILTLIWLVKRSLPLAGLLACICGLIIAATLPWWRYLANSHFDISNAELNVTGEICLVSLILMARELVTEELQKPMIWAKRIILITFVIFGIFLSFATGPTINADIRLTAWHHWGAYIGPAELLYNGLHIFKDFPVQYGLGPTLLIAGACGDNCWNGMYYLAGGATFLLFLSVFYIAMSTKMRTESGLFITIICLTALFSAVFFWTAYPPRVATAIITPSVSGLRFLPPAVLVAIILWVEGRGYWKSRWLILIHVIWAIGALWSPEALFMSSIIWWPYYIWRELSERPQQKFIPTFIRSLATLIGVFVATFAVFLISYWLIYNDLPSSTAYLTFMLYPPGPMPIDPNGPIWVSVATLILGIYSVYRLFRLSSTSLQLKQSILVILLGYGALSYCMGRSHDNNFLNVAPFTVLILVTIVSSRLSAFFRMAAAGLLVSFIGWMSVFGWNPWTEAAHAGRLFELRPHRLVSSFSYKNPESANLLGNLITVNGINGGDPHDAKRAMDEIKRISGEPVTIIDNLYMRNRENPTDVWNAFNDAANYTFIPDEIRREFMTNTAVRLQRSGWLVIDKKILQPWLDDYLIAYNVTEDLDFGSYRALHMTPKAAQ